MSELVLLPSVRREFSDSHQQNYIRSKIPSRKWVLTAWMNTQGDSHPLSQYQGFLWSSTARRLETVSAWRWRCQSSDKPVSSVTKIKAIHKTYNIQRDIFWHDDPMRRRTGWKTTFRGGKSGSFFGRRYTWWGGRGPPILAANTVDWDFPRKLLFTGNSECKWFNKG